MSEDVTQFYDKDVQGSISMELVDLNHTGSWDDSENQVCVITAPESVARSLRRAYRSMDISGIKDFELSSTDEVNESGETMYEIHAGSSYGAGQLMGSVGKLVYNSSEFGTEFENQY